MACPGGSRGVRRNPCDAEKRVRLVLQVAPVRIFILVPQGGVAEGFFEDAVQDAAGKGAGIFALYVIDPAWSSYSASDWLSNASSRLEFIAYMRDCSLDEGQTLLDRLGTVAAASGVSFYCRISEGDPAEEMKKFAHEMEKESPA